MKCPECGTLMVYILCIPSAHVRDASANAYGCYNCNAVVWRFAYDM